MWPQWTARPTQRSQTSTARADMLVIDRFRAEDRAAVDALFVRLHGSDAAQAFLQRWPWQYERNPKVVGGAPLVWLARVDDEVVGQYSTLPVTLTVNGTEIDAAWGVDAMVNAEHQGKGFGRILYETAQANFGASLALGMSDASQALFTKLKWHDLGRVPRLVKSMSARVQNTPPTSGPPWARLRFAVRNLMAHLRSPSDIQVITRFDDGVSQLWERVGKHFAFAVRRDAAYLNWKFVDAPHLEYQIATCVRAGETCGYAIIRHSEKDGWRATIIADFLADPRQPGVLQSLLRWVDREAIAAQSDVIRVVATHAQFIEKLHGAGYADRAPVVRFMVRIDGVTVPANYFDSVAAWHVTIGDSDNER